MNDYRELIVWQKSMKLAVEVHGLSKRFPADEAYGLTSQIRRASVSIPSNIAEGTARKNATEYRNYLSIARGSLAEVHTQLLLAKEFDYLNSNEIEGVLCLSGEIARMLTTMIQKLR